MARGPRIGRAALAGAAALLGATTLAVPSVAAEPGHPADGDHPAACLTGGDIEAVADSPHVPWEPTPFTTGLTVRVTGTDACLVGTELKVTVTGPWQGAWQTDDGTIRTVGSTQVWALPPLAVGQVVEMRVPITFPTPLPSIWGWDAQLRTSVDGVFQVAHADVVVDHTCSDVQLRADIEQTLVLAGSPTTATVTATNAGTCDLVYPVPVVVAGPYRDLLGDPTVDAGTLDGATWTLTHLAPGETATMRFGGTVPAGTGVRGLASQVQLYGDPPAGNHDSDRLAVYDRPAITGTVTGPDGEPVAGVRVTAYGWFNGWTPVVRSVTTSAGGAYSLDELPRAVRYQVAVTDPSGRYHRAWVGGGESRPGGAGVATRGGEVTVADVQLRLREANALDVAVVGPTGDPRADIWVTVFDEHGFVAGAVTGADGHAVVDDLTPGTYWVRAWPLDATTPAEWYLDAPTRAAATAVPVPAGTVAVAVQLDA